MANRTIELKILDPRIGPGRPFDLPEYQTAGAAGVDLRAMMPTSSYVLRPGEAYLIPTGIAVHIRDKSLTGIIIPRSGLGHNRGIVMGNGTGLIDSDYTGMLYVSCYNRSGVQYTITVGERIAQLVILPVVQAQFRVVEEFSPSKRGANGFGSTGAL